MTDNQYQLFLATYFCEKEQLKELVDYYNGFLIQIDNPEPNGSSILTVVSFTVGEILKMTSDGMEDFKDKTSLTNFEKVNPSQIFSNARTCIDRLIKNSPFPQHQEEEVNYHDYINLMYVSDKDEPWFGEQEIELFIEDGYRKIDIELINAAIKLNRERSIELLNLGANPFIDPDDLINKSNVLTSLAIECGLAISSYFAIHEDYQKYGKSYFKPTDCFRMIEYLYKIAGSSNLYNLLTNFDFSKVPQNLVTLTEQDYFHLGKKSEGFIKVKTGTFENPKCGFLNEIHQIVIPLIYPNVKDFKEGLAAVRVGNWASNKWGFINTKGEMVIPPIFEHPRFFSSGLAKVILNNEWCFIDTSGNKIISLKGYDGSSSFHNGHALVWKSGVPYNNNTLFGIIDKTGTEVIPCHKPKTFFRCSNLGLSVQAYKMGFDDFIF